MYQFVHVDSRCGHVSISLFGHSVQLGFGWVSGPNVFNRCLPMYCAYHNFSICMFCALEMLGACQKTIG